MSDATRPDLKPEDVEALIDYLGQVGSMVESTRHVATARAMKAVIEKLEAAALVLLLPPMDGRTYDPFQPIGKAASAVVAKCAPAPTPLRKSARFRLLSERLHTLGPRAVGEMLSELAQANYCNNDAMRRLETYARLDPETLSALGGDAWPGLSEVGDEP
jgi:hypothetical protein